MAANRKTQIPTGDITLRPGWLIVNTSSATGGVTYGRTYLSEDRDGEIVNSEFLTKKKVDNEKIVKEIDALAKRADYICRQHCVNTAIGWVADSSALEEIAMAFNDLRSNAGELNRLAAAVGSRHRAHINYVPAFLDVSNPEAAAEIGRTVRESLGAILDALRAGDVTDGKLDGKVVRRQTLRPAMLKAAGLDKLAIGLAAESIKEALKCAEAAKESIKAAIKGGASPEAAGRSVDLEAIEVAIIWFTGNGT